MSKHSFIPLRDLCNNFKADIVDGPFGANLKREHYKTEGIPVLKIQNVKPFKITLKKMDFVNNEKYEELKRHSYKTGDIIMTKLGDPLGESAIVDGIEDGLIVADLVRIRAQKIDTKYLCYHLNSPVTNEYINSQQKGTTRPRVRISVVRDLPIYAPPLEEQKRIVAILDQAFADIERVRANTEQNRNNARALFESYLQQVFSQRGECYKQVTLSEITECISDGDHSAPPKSPEGIPFITISNINKSTNVIDFSNTFTVPEDYYAALKETRKPQLGDVLYTVTGSYGIPVIVREKKKFCFQRHIGLIRPNKEVDSQWLYYLLMSPQVYSQADRGATGTAQKTVSLTLLRNILVPNIPLDIQKEMASSLDIMYEQSKKLENIYSVKVESLDELKKSILQKAFSGELTANTDQGAVA